MNDKLSTFTTSCWVSLLLASLFCCLEVHAQPVGSSVPDVRAATTDRAANGVAAVANNEAAVSGEAVITNAVTRTLEYRSITARMRVRTDLMGQPLVGSGKYAQLGSSVGPLLRLELAIQAGEQATSVKQIATVTDLWEHWRIGGKEKLNRIDLRRVQAAIKKAPGKALSTSTSSSLATGGLPKLLQQLNENFDFAKKPVRSGSIGEVPVMAVRGVWRAEKLAAAAPNAVEGDTIFFEKLPLHLPHEVEVLIGKSDAFPYRVTYQQFQSIEGKHELKPVVTTEFFEVAVNQPLDPSQFQFQEPANISSTDRTDVFLQTLGLTPTEVARTPDETQRK